MLIKIFLTPTAEAKLLDMHGFTSDRICKVFLLPFQIKKVTQKQRFNIRLFTIFLIPAKVSLFKAKICDHDILPQCLADRHLLDHMFLRCQITLSFRPRLFESRLRLGLHQSRFFRILKCFRTHQFQSIRISGRLTLTVYKGRQLREHS